MLKMISFGKIDFNGCGRRINEVVVEMRLNTIGEQVEFVAHGYIYNSKKTDALCIGQCLDTIAEYINTPLFQEIHRLWKDYHLNTLNPGTLEQTKAVKEWEAAGHKYNYTEVVEYLKSIGLYEVSRNGRPYRYGQGWIYHPIPEADLARIRAIMES